VPAEQTCRNHCSECLHSLHVDKNPGDRAEDCGGILEPVGVEMERGELKNLIFRCQKCGQKRKNRLALDDNREKALDLAKKQAERLARGLE